LTTILSTLFHGCGIALYHKSGINCRIRGLIVKYQVQFCNAWVGTWTYDANNDVIAWEKAWKKIKEQTLTVKVEIDYITEVDDNGIMLRKLPEYEDCKKEGARSGICNTKKENAMYIAFFDNGQYFGPYLAKYSLNKKYAKDIVLDYLRLKADSIKIIQLAELENKAVYKAYFSDGKYSVPYIANITEKDAEALEKARYKLQQHIENNGLHDKKIKLKQVIELNEDMNFEVNVEREEKENSRKIHKQGDIKDRVLTLMG